MKDKILALRAEGKSYNEIKAILGCSKSTISFHCGEGQKEKNKIRAASFRLKNPVLRKIDNFINRGVSVKCRDFQRNRDLGIYTNGRQFLFNIKDVLNKIGENPKCYLTGREIDLSKPNTYHFDHIIPVANGGDSNLDNLGITCRSVNIAKGTLSVDDFILLCKEVVKYNQ
ncbi:MAG: HNH endonuclease [Saprospiraceae bacterium]|nr:HNH endonuclease [Saprospiraceae bacterium]MBP6567247.1 HNH endonuclease [Saprospiraceae bacterium]